MKGRGRGRGRGRGTGQCDGRKLRERGKRKRNFGKGRKVGREKGCQ